MVLILESEGLEAIVPVRGRIEGGHVVTENDRFKIGSVNPLALQVWEGLTVRVFFDDGFKAEFVDRW